MDDLERARRESAELLGLDPDKLTAADRLQCELIAALRAAVDDELGKVTSARSADLGKLIIAVETLTRFLREARTTTTETEDDGNDARASLMRTIENWIAADEAEKAERAAERREQGLSEPAADLESAQARIDELEAELARLRGEEPRALPSPESERTITPGEADIIEPSKLYVGPPPRGPNDPPPRSTAIIDHEPAPTAAEREARRQAINNDRSAYTQQGLRPAGGEQWRGHAGGVDESFFWGGSTGKRAW